MIPIKVVHSNRQILYDYCHLSRAGMYSSLPGHMLKVFLPLEVEEIFYSLV